MVGKKLLGVLLFLSCVWGSCTHDKQTDAVSAATARRGPTVPSLLERYMPGAMKDGVVKIAVLVHQKAGDTSRQFIDGCVSEGRAMGFTVDSFVSGGDETRCREIAAGIAQADYDGLIFANNSIMGDISAKNTYPALQGEVVNFSYDILKPIADAGIPIVTFEALPYQDGKSIKGLITTFQDDYSLARVSLEELRSCVQNAANRPLKVIRMECESKIISLDRRVWEFNQLIGEGKIEETALVKLNSLDNVSNAAGEALAAILPHFPPGAVDALWVPWDAIAGSCAEALAAAGRQDIKMISIGISNDDLRLMQLHASLWIASVAVDPQLAGRVNTRILAAQLAGETMNHTFSFSPQLVKTADLNHAVNIANLSLMIPGWGDGKGLFDQYQWMSDLKTSGERYLRLPPVPASGGAASAASP